MSLFLKILAAAAVLAMAGAAPAAAAPAGWSLVGTWTITVKGDQCAATQILRIKSADASKIVGTSNVGDGYGKIVNGSFDGVNVTFTDQFFWDGRNQSELWKFKLTGNGNTIRGSYKNNDGQHATCRFSGPRS